LYKEDKQTESILSLIELEKNSGYENINIYEKKIWEYIRIKVLNKILLTKKIIEKTIKGKEINNKSIFCYVINFFRFHTFNKADIIVFSNPRRIYSKEHKVFEDPYTDPWIDEIKGKIKIVEKRNFDGHKRPVKNDIIYLDFIDAIIVLLCKISSVNFDNVEKQQIIKVKNDIKSCFGIEIDISILIKQEIKRANIEEKIYSLYFRVVKPKALILICSYGKENIIKAAKKLNIKVIEVQHGVINQYHLGYHYPNFKKESFPDYFLAYGSYWTESTVLPIPEENIRIVGYPYLEQYRARVSLQKKKNQIVVVSQGQIGSLLADFICDFIDLNNNVKVFYKLHPGERHNWENNYPNLFEKRNKLEVIDSEYPNIYELLIESKWQIGVNSTSIFEGFYLGCKTFILDLPGVTYMEDFIRKRYGILVKKPEEIILDSDSHPQEFNREELFIKDSLNSIVKEINSIINQE